MTREIIPQRGALLRTQTGPQLGFPLNQPLDAAPLRPASCCASAAAPGRRRTITRASGFKRLRRSALVFRPAVRGEKGHIVFRRCGKTRGCVLITVAHRRVGARTGTAWRASEDWETLRAQTLLAADKPGSLLPPQRCERAKYEHLHDRNTAQCVSHRKESPVPALCSSPR